ISISVAEATPVRAQGEAPACWVRSDPSELALRASPFDSTAIALEAGTVKVCYSRPQMRGRAIMGGLVPVGEPWRLGANEATAIYVGFPATIGGVAVEPGWYSLYAIPMETEWRIVVNGAVERWGIPIRDEVRARDVGEGTLPVERTTEPVELLTLTLEPSGSGGAELIIEWDRTRVRLPIGAQ
ncbi:MAG: DUF2911 domain-containing protein, partial [Longimicrobiales bacterium]